MENLFRGIVGKAKKFLQAIIREKDMPPKPVLNMDIDEFSTMQNIMLKVQKQVKAIKKLQEATLLNLRQQLTETTGIFKGKERKDLEKQIQQTEAELDEKLDKLLIWNDICKAHPKPCFFTRNVDMLYIHIYNMYKFAVLGKCEYINRKEIQHEKRIIWKITVSCSCSSYDFCFILLRKK